MPTPWKCPRGTRVQTLLFSKERFPRSTSALAWARHHGFTAKKADVAETGSGRQYHRVRQAPPGRFIRDSFRMIDFKPGVKAIVACPK